MIWYIFFISFILNLILINVILYQIIISKDKYVKDLSIRMRQLKGLFIIFMLFVCCVPYILIPSLVMTIITLDKTID